LKHVFKKRICSATLRPIPELSWKRKELPVGGAGFSAVAKRHNFRKFGFIRDRGEARYPNFTRKIAKNYQLLRKNYQFTEEKMPNENNSPALAPLPKIILATVIRFSGPDFPGCASALHLLRPHGR
jgi:hypothetical protein